MEDGFIRGGNALNPIKEQKGRKGKESKKMQHAKS